MKMTYTVGKSRIEQTVSIRSGSRQINFATKADWQETASMLRVAFPVDICTDQAGFDVQFGQFFRPTHNNTTWDQARNDVTAHTWADLSESDYGVALLNDCKYGHRVKGSVLDLSLIRCVLGPNALVDPNAVREEDFSSTFTDLGRHEFTYALLPHDGNTASAGLKHAGACLNVPLIVVETAASSGAQPAQKSWLEVSDGDVRIEAVKQAEDGRGVVLRLSETTGTRRKVTITSAIVFEAACETDLLERNPIDLNASEGVISLTFKPFEIKTILLK
jgi:alpha-mannosidase